MECNRDEATRAKKIAEKKFASKDIAGDGCALDKNKRNEYDQRRFSRLRESAIHRWGSIGSIRTNGFHNFNNNASSKSGARKPLVMGSFNCCSFLTKTRYILDFLQSMQDAVYEYVRVYLNCNLLCPNCHESFLAFETAAPPSNGSSSSHLGLPLSQRQNQISILQIRTCHL
ncbi:hypothetical protein IFM89_030121 [Coptis chinensis]|uniref:Zinc beta-ribbon domain-containing protein n=1 Tax=Coptis chinensis TaxID=261450 RepID=A0A835M013_9MAGN|nr:hypothetical protein IFM89_030121 [Coptis chinensis]